MRASLVYCVMIVSAACGAQMSFTKTGDTAHAAQPRGPAQVDLFTKGRPARPHDEVGVIEADREDDEAEVFAKMREYAASLGCDALVIPSGDGSDGYRGQCLVYTAPPLMQPPPAAAPGTAISTCIPNAPQPCYGPGGCRGNQLCSGDGKSFTPCDCGGH